MEIRNNVENLRTLLGVNPATNAQGAQGAQGTQAAQNATGRQGTAGAAQQLPGDHATLSSLGTQAAESGANGGVRLDKVAAVQSALAAGTYSVSAKAVAGKIVDSLLGASGGGGR